MPDCLGPIEFIAWLCNDTAVTQDRQFIDSYLRGPESLTFCRCYYLQRLPFTLSYLKNLSFGSAGVWTSAASCTTHRHLSNRANQPAGSHVSVNVSNFPCWCCPFHYPSYVHWTLDFVVIIFICLVLLIKDGCLWHFIPLHTYERLLLYILGALRLF